MMAMLMLAQVAFGALVIYLLARDLWENIHD